ncbi:MAG: BON domain-containing protein [Candidatus Manganitrophaceae bacterium]|nr:MAG: BON domain-containing protein [Candidatus Manganitrophaceae bacterium]
MNKGLSMIGGIGLGAGLEYLFDPEMGDRRRAMIRDKAVEALNKAEEAIEVTAKDVQNRVAGLVSELRSRVTEMGEEISDEVLEARIRAKLGMVSAHPGAIEIRVNNGQVTLSGPILAEESERVLSAISAIKGVSGVENQLESHETADNVPSLQGGRRRMQPFELMRENWSPSARTLMGFTGTVLTLYGLRRDGFFRTMVGTVGLGIVARSITNMPMKQMVGIGAGPDVIDVQKTIAIAAPVEKVFEFWNNFQNFPKFMANVREVQLKEEGKSHWVVSGPAGIPVEWDAEITERIPNKLIAWKTVPGSVVEHAGVVRFDSNSDGTTRVDIKMSYNPPAGALGHVVATLFGADPKSEMDADLARMKTLIETGIRPHDAAAA